MKRNIQIYDRIKYDRKSVRKYGKAALISLAVIAITFILILVLGVFVFGLDGVSRLAPIIMLMDCVLIYCLFVGVLYLDGKIYLWDLKKKGFVVPENKEDYDCKLSMLPREESEVPKRAIHIRTLVLSLIAGLITISATICGFTVAKRPFPLLCLIAFIVTVIMFLQSLNRFYKNDIDVEIVDSRRVRQRIIPATITVLIVFFGLCCGALMTKSFPTFNYLYHDQIMRYLKADDPESWRFHMDSLPSYAEDIEFMSWGKVIGLSFHVPQENIKDIQAYFEGFGEPYVIHTIEEGQDEFTELCTEVKKGVTNFDSKDYENCIVYEFTEWGVVEQGQTRYNISWYAIIDTESGEVGYGNYPKD